MARLRLQTLTVFAATLASAVLPADSSARQLALEDYYRIVTVQSPAILARRSASGSV